MDTISVLARCVVLLALAAHLVSDIDGIANSVGSRVFGTKGADMLLSLASHVFMLGIMWAGNMLPWQGG